MKRLAIVAAVLALSMAALAGCGSPESLYQSKCGPCHASLDQLVDAKAASYATLDDWRAMISDMQAETDTISDADADTIAQYLYDKYNA